MSSTPEEGIVPGVIVFSVDKLSPEYIIQKILNVETLPSPSICNGTITGFDYKIDNKYYTATVILYAASGKTELDAEVLKGIEGVIIYFNGNEPSSFEDVIKWVPILKDMPTEVHLLICDSCQRGPHLQRVLNWCVKNEFELIELDGDLSEEEDDGLFGNFTGFGRVADALQCFTWSNLVEKGNSRQENRLVQNGDHETNNHAESSASSKENTDSSKTMKVEGEEVLLEEQWLQKVLEQDDPEGESFEALFSKFASMKERANGLTGEERKKYAEKVACAFWKAMGGEEDEIAGLDDE